MGNVQFAVLRYVYWLFYSQYLVECKIKNKYIDLYIAKLYLRLEFTYDLLKLVGL